MEFSCRELPKPIKIQPEVICVRWVPLKEHKLDRRLKQWPIRGILVVGKSPPNLPKQKPMLVRTHACYQAHGS